MSGPAGRENAALRPGEAAGCGGFFTKPQIQNSRFKIQNYKLGAQPAEAPFEADLRDRFHLRTARGIVSVRQDGSPQPPIFAEIFCSKLDCAAVGSPQQPPRRRAAISRSSKAGPSARLRAGLVAGINRQRGRTAAPRLRPARPGPCATHRLPKRQIRPTATRPAS